MIAGIYTRFSTEHQHSTETQVESCLEYCKTKGYEVYKIYSDEVESGASLNRPIFTELINDAEQKLFEVIVIHDMFRGSRDVVDWFSLRKRLNSLNIKIESTLQKIGDLLNPSDFITELVTIGIGQHDLLLYRQKSIDGKYTKARQGLFLGGFAPLGYDIVNQKYMINEREAEAVRLIFKMYSVGESYKKICEAVKALGVVGKRGHPISTTTLYSILTNPRYKGEYVWMENQNREMHKWVGRKNEKVVKIDNVIPQIVGDELWDTAQKRLADKKSRARNSAKRNYLLSGLIVCPKCGSLFHGTTKKGRNESVTISYLCPNKARKLCDTENINAIDAEDSVRKAVKEWLEKLDVEEFAETVLTHQTAVDKPTKYKEEYLTVEREIFNITQAIKKGVIYDELLQELEILKNRKIELEKKINLKEKAIKNIELYKASIIQTLQNQIKLANSDQIDSVVKTFVKKITPRKSQLLDIYMGVEGITGSPGREALMIATLHAFMTVKKSTFRRALFI